MNHKKKRDKKVINEPTTYNEPALAILSPTPDLLLRNTWGPYCRHIMAAAEEVLKLLDSYWFEYGVFTAKPPPLSTPEQNPVLHHDEVHEEPIFNLSRIQTFRLRSLSDHCLSSRDSSGSDFLTPNSVLNTPKLETILSGKEGQEFAEPKKKPEDIETTTTMERRLKERRRRKKGDSRSLSELEFEELRGFMDLGFVFSEEDKNSSLVSILPGLQRLGRKVDNNGVDDEDEDKDEEEGRVKEIHGGSAVVSRPYLSEAWDVLDQTHQRKVDISTKPLTLNPRIPALGNEMENIRKIQMKQSLREDYLIFLFHSS